LCRGNDLDGGRNSRLGFSLDLLASLLVRVTGLPVLNQIAVEGTFDLHLDWDADHPETVREALLKRTGLELREARRIVRVDARGAWRPHFPLKLPSPDRVA
jgi:hypothetical protein